MGTYQPLFSITIEHAYFANHSCKSLDFRPTTACRASLQNAGLILKSSECGIAVFCEDDKLDILRLHAEDGLTLTFKVSSKDPRFILYTTPAARRDDAVLFFSNQEVARDENGAQMLHKGQYASEQAFIPLDSKQLDDVLECKDYVARPDFIVQIRISAQEGGLCSENIDKEARKFYIRFAVNQTFWKYFILGELSERNLYIADLDNEIQFANVGETTLPGSRKGIMLQSSVPIEMQEMQTKRFQLREQGSMGDKVLIKRMPNASLDFMNGEMIGGKMENVSEIYIN